MAQAFPNSTFVGFDYHERRDRDGARRGPRRPASATGRASRSRRRRATRARGYDLVTMFDCLHDMGDPAGAARHVRETLAPDGTWLIVEPTAGDRVEDNLNPVGRAYYGFSTLLCTPASLSQEVGLALGAQAGEARIRDVVTSGGLHPVPPGGRDAVQPRLRGAALTLSDGTRQTEEHRASRAGRPKGFVERDGRAHPLGALRRRREPAVLFLPSWSIVHSRVWKAQIPYFARRFRVLTFDARGNGKSDRPADAAAYSERECAADALAVLDATGTELGGARRRSRAARSAALLARGRASGTGRRLVVHRPAAADPAASRAALDLRRRARAATRAGTSTTRTTGAATTAGFLEFFFGEDASPSRTRRSRSRTASAGRSRPTRRR